MTPSPSSDLPAAPASPAGAAEELARVQEALRQSELLRRQSQSYFEKSFNSSPAFMAIARARDNVVLEINPSFLTASGYTREEVVGRSTLDLGIWVRREQREEFLGRFRRDRLVRDFEAEFCTKSGRVRTLILNADYLELGGEVCMLTVGIDITERRRHERTQAATYQISQIILGGGDLPALFKEVHRIIGGLMPARNFYVALLDPERSVLSFPYFVDESLPPPPPRVVRNGITEYVIETGEPLLTTEQGIVDKLTARGTYQPSGNPRAQWMGAPLLVDGRGIGVIAVQDYHNAQAYTDADLQLLVFVADQTAAAIRQQEAEAAQRESRLYFEKSFYSSPALMTISRLRDGCIIEANPAFTRSSGYTREEALGKTSLQLNLWVELAQRQKFLEEVRLHGVVRDLQADFRAKDGRITTILVNADLLELGGEQCILVVGIDITERRRRERVQAATYQISRAVLAGGSLDVLFREVHTIIGGLMPVRNFYVALLSPDGEELSFPYFVDETAPPPAPRRRGFGLTEYVLHTARPLRTTADELTVILRGDSRYKPTGKPSALWLGAPLMIDGRAIGVIAVQDYHNPKAYTEADLELLMFVADQIAAAVYRQQVEAAERETRSYFERSFASSPALMWITQFHDRRIVEVNPAFTRTTGYAREEVIGHTTHELNLWVDESHRLDFAGRITQQGVVRDLQADIRTKRGRIETLLINADVLEMGGQRCVLTVAIDITERRRREQVQAATFQISRAVLTGGNLEMLFAEVHSIISGLMPAKNFYVALLSADGRELSFPYFVDEYIAAALPRAPGNGFTELVIDTQRPLLVSGQELPALLSARGPYQPLEKPAAQRLGAPLIGGGRTLGVIALQDYDRPDAYGEEDLRLLNFVAEQTAAAVQRRQAEIALARAEQRYRSIYENAVEGLYISTPEGHFVSANPAFARMLGYDTTAEMLGAVNDIKRQIYVQRGRRDEFFAQIQQRDEISDFESEVYRRDGSTFWMSESVRVVRKPSGAIDHFEGMATDVTHKREAERALRQAKETADAASRAKSYFLASVSHELRTPLNGILGYTQILRRDGALNDKQRDGIRIIHESADHLLALINDVLDLSKIEAGRIELHPADFDLPEFARSVESVFTPRAREKSILFETAVAANLPRWVQGDEQRLRQVVFNLVSNAVKFTQAGGVVLSIQRVDKQAATPTIRFSVSDTGPGIAEEDLAKLFQPFAQVGNKATAAASGTGLGLAISRSLVERMGGRLQVESKPGWGSRFWFEVALPLASGVQPVADAKQRIVGYEGPRKRILIVDDNAANRAVLVDMLAPLGFELAEAEDGAAALETTEEFAPDLVLMDLRLPGGIDGIEATRRLRARPNGRALRIIAVSASAYDVDRTECFAAGCDEFLAKPFREDDLRAGLARTLGLRWRVAGADEPRLAFPPVMEPPPGAEAAAIHELAEKGDVVGIRARAQALLALDPKYAPFAQNVLDLAGRFKMKAIRQFVARFIP